MKYTIYFDESNKLDHTKVYSYYGAIGVETDTVSQISKKVKNIIQSNNELHFSGYKKDTKIKRYFHVLNYIINQDISFNIFVVNNSDAMRVSEKLNFSIEELRSLFYIKIPERLFYGITRNINDLTDVNITVDRNDEYRKLRLYSKIKEQMNAHSVYRNMNYRIKNVKSKQSHNSIPLQIIDLMIGITVFLMEKTYLNNTVTSTAKSDLLYRFLIQGDNFKKYQDKLKLFKWDVKDDNLQLISIDEYISEFLINKHAYDIQEIIRFQTFLHTKPNKNMAKYQNLMQYSNSLRNMLIGYKDEIEGRGRNYSL